MKSESIPVKAMWHSKIWRFVKSNVVIIVLVLAVSYQQSRIIDLEHDMIGMKAKVWGWFAYEPITDIVDRLADEVKALESKAADFEGRSDDINSSSSDLESRIETIESGISNLESDISDLESGISDVEYKVRKIERNSW